MYHSYRKLVQYFIQLGVRECAYDHSCKRVMVISCLVLLYLIFRGSTDCLISLNSKLELSHCFCHVLVTFLHLICISYILLTVQSGVLIWGTAPSTSLHLHDTMQKNTIKLIEYPAFFSKFSFLVHQRAVGDFSLSQDLHSFIVPLAIPEVKLGVSTYAFIHCLSVKAPNISFVSFFQTQSVYTMDFVDCRSFSLPPTLHTYNPHMSRFKLTIPYWPPRRVNIWTFTPPDVI